MLVSASQKRYHKHLCRPGQVVKDGLSCRFALILETVAANHLLGATSRPLPVHLTKRAERLEVQQALPFAIQTVAAIFVRVLRQ